MSEVDPFAKVRQALVEESIRPSGVTDPRVLKAFLSVPRHEFVFHEYTEQAYADGPLPIGEDQVIIQPSLAARVTQALHLQESEMNTHPAWSTGVRGVITTTVTKAHQSSFILSNSSSLVLGASMPTLFKYIEDSSMPTSQDKLSDLSHTQAWRFAGLVQERLTHPVDETVRAVPESPTPGPQDWNGGVFTYVAPNSAQVRVGRTRNAVERGGKTWVDFSQDGGKTWQRKTAITKDDETAGGRAIVSVERPYVYGKIVDGEPWVVLGTCAAEKGTKCWDIHEREAPVLAT